MVHDCEADRRGKRLAYLDLLLEVAFEARVEHLTLGGLEAVNQARNGPLVIFHLQTGEY